MITPEEYLRFRGWHKQCDDAGDGNGPRWAAPVGHSDGCATCDMCTIGSTVEAATRIQVLRDENCGAFQRSRMATIVLEECTRSNAERREM